MAASGGLRLSFRLTRITDTRRLCVELMLMLLGWLRNCVFEVYQNLHPRPVDKRQLRSADQGVPASGPSPVKFTGEGWGEGAGGPAKIATDQDSPSAPVRWCIWWRSENPHPTLALVRERAPIRSSPDNSEHRTFNLQAAFRQSLNVREGITKRWRLFLCRRAEQGWRRVEFGIRRKPGGPVAGRVI
jgi:hypothetical protein